MKVTKRQLRRIIKEEKAKVLAEKKIRRIVRRKLLEQVGGHVVSGKHKGQEFSVPVPDALAQKILDAHAALLAISPSGDVFSADFNSPEAIAFGDAAGEVYNYAALEIEKQTGSRVDPKFGIDGEYHQDGSQLSDALDAAGEFI